MRDSLMLDFVSPCGDYVLTFEDDGRVAYAYLKRCSESAIVGDVWLYNRCPTPADPEWTDREKIPFANSREYTDPCATMQRQVGPADVLVAWESEDSGPVAYVYVFEDLLAVVGVGDMPGYARFAVRDCRLARVMEITD